MSNSLAPRNSNPSSPRSLFINHTLDEFPTNDLTTLPPPVGSIKWTAAQRDWNAWKSLELDSGPYAKTPSKAISAGLLRKEQAKGISSRVKADRESLPVRAHRQEILQAVEGGQVVLVKGTTGCGKSTQICQYLLESHLEADRGAHFNCYVSQPRRISAITLAERVAYECGEQLGESVGYAVRFETVTPRPYGAIMFVTVGMLLRRMESGLRGISHLVIDEIHERDMQTDFLLIVVRDMVRANPKLKVVLMSATIEAQMFTEYFGQCKVVEIEQRLHQVSGGTQIISL